MEIVPNALTIDYLRRTPSAVLLFVQLAGILLYPLMEKSPFGRVLFTSFGLVVLGVALRVVRRSPQATWLGFLLAILVVVLYTISVFAPHPALPVTIAMLEAAFYFYAAFGLIVYMMQDYVATADELFAAGATFTLLVWAFAYVYAAYQGIAPGSFSSPANPQGLRTWMELLYLSIALLSGVGLSDIVPVTPFARALVMLEAFSGVMYIALVVSRLVALTVLSSRDRR